MSPVTTEDLEPFNRKFLRGRLKAADIELLRLEAANASDPRVRHARALLDAQRKVVTFADAEQSVRVLASENPELPRLRASAANLRAKAGDVDGAVDELRQLVIANPEESFIHVSLAALLQAKKETWVESWRHYEIALQEGPLSSTCLKCAAYYVARRVEPSKAALVLRESSSLERLVVRTRGGGPLLMMYLFLVLVASAFYLLSRHVDVVGSAITVMAVACGAWCTYVSDFACCKKCRDYWLTLTIFTLTWILLAPSLSSGKPSIFTWLVLGELGVFVVRALIAGARREQAKAIARAERTP